MIKTTTLTKEQGIAIIRWYESEGQNNWGGWGHYPTLGLGASYLQYDINQCQINFDTPVIIDGEEYNCISAGRAVGKKWSNFISFSELRRWCLPEEQQAIEDAHHNSMLAGYNTAMANFNSLPENIKSELLSLTVESCGSNNKRKSAIYTYVGANADAILPVISSKNVRQIIDCIQYNHKYFSL